MLIRTQVRLISGPASVDEPAETGGRPAPSRLLVAFKASQAVPMRCAAIVNNMRLSMLESSQRVYVATECPSYDHTRRTACQREAHQHVSANRSWTLRAWRDAFNSPQEAHERRVLQLPVWLAGGLLPNCCSAADLFWSTPCCAIHRTMTSRSLPSGPKARRRDCQGHALSLHRSLAPSHSACLQLFFGWITFAQPYNTSSIPTSKPRPVNTR